MTQAIRKLLKEKNAILLAHNYQPPQIQDIADLCGDSLELSIKAARTDAQVIVFCGVSFMAETASILSPEKRVLLPRMDAGCPMANMITPEALDVKMAELPPMPVVTYVNSTAAVKAKSTICCTSANAAMVVNSLGVDELLMGPDRNLARNTAARTGKKIHEWHGYCPFHDRLTPEEILLARKAHPDALVLVHPECRPEVVAMADAVESTSGMIRYARDSTKQEFIVGTEMGMLYPLGKALPQKRFYPASEAMVCPDMKKISMEDIERCLVEMTGEVRVPESIRVPAKQAVQRMIELSAG